MKRISNLETLKSQLKTLAANKKEFNGKIKDYQKIVVESESTLTRIDDALLYLKNPKSFRIATIDEDIKTLEKKVNKIETFLSEIEALDISKISANNSTFQEFNNTQDNLLTNKKNELRRSREQLQVLKNALDKINALMIDIKYYGKEYIEAKENLDACPLCNTPHTKAELEAKVQTQYNDKESAKSIEIFNKNISELEKEISKINIKLEQSKSYEKLLKGYFTEEDLKVKISEVQPLLDTEKSQLAISKKELDQLKNLSLDLRLEGYSLDDFLKLKNTLSSKYPTLEFKAENKSKFEDLKNNAQKKIDTIRSEIEKVNEQLYKLDESIKELLDDNFSQDRYNEEIDFQIKEYQSYREYFVKLRTYIDFTKDDFIIEMRHSLESLNKTFSTFKEQKVKFEEFTLANKLIKEADSRIEKLKPKKARATSALKVLNKIILEDSEEKVLVDFFQKNENEISEIFTSIHAPKEFSRLSFSSNKIVLYKKDSEQEVPISQISTGQRSALALSVFLALNKKLAKGPNLIIFDDPVTYTDDLNILSFLDYLRSMVINESRQLIFATASNKIARLFQKKFDFLKTDFQKFELSRSIN